MSPITSLPARSASLGPGLTVHRALPLPGRRTVGPWCFADHFGPADLHGADLAIGPHPHIGLQTVTWLVEGELVHGDSLGSHQPIRPGQLNLMTAGAGITHWELPATPHRQRIHGAQLWVALPDSVRQGDPHFEHHAELPQARVGDATLTLLLGRLAGLRAPATTWSPMVGAELVLPGGGLSLPLERRFEHALLVLEGHLRVGGTDLGPQALHLLPTGADRLEASATSFARALLLGGEPFREPLLMWWNFVARSPDEIARARAGWQAREGFGDPAAWPAPPIEAPPLPAAGLRLRA